jgi:hypothetical protein
MQQLYQSAVGNNATIFAIRGINYNATIFALPAVAHQAFAHMMYAGDPHAGNILVRPGLSETIDGRGEGLKIVLLDWGLTKRFPEEKRIALCKLCLAAATFDFGMMLDLFKATGLQMKVYFVSFYIVYAGVPTRVKILRGSLQHSRSKMLPKIWRGFAFSYETWPLGNSRRNELKRRIEAIWTVWTIRERSEEIPMDSKAHPAGELFLFMRVNEMLSGFGSKLAIDLAHMEVIKPYAERGITRSIPPCTSAGSKAEDSEHIDAALSNLLSSEMGLRIIASHSRGHMTLQAVILGYSCTKAITATVAHIMVEEAYLSLDEPRKRTVSIILFE